MAKITLQEQFANTVLKFFRQFGLDTLDISRLVNRPESEVYRLLHEERSAEIYPDAPAKCEPPVEDGSWEDVSE